MSMEAETGEMIVRVTLDGIERTVRVSGTATMMAGKMLIFLVAALSKGKPRDIALNPGGMCTVTIPEKDKKEFSKLAGKYHLKYFIAKDRSHEDGLCDICARNEDAQVLARICEKLGIGIIEKSKASVENHMDFKSAAKMKAKESLTFNKALNRITENDFSKDTPRFICERTDPNRYMELHSSYEVFEGEGYTKTRYVVFRDGEKCGEYDDGRFADRPKNYWQKQKAEMKEVGGFTDDVILFNEKADFDKYKELHANQSSIKVVSAEELKQNMSSEIDKYMVRDGRSNPTKASELAVSQRSEAGVKDSMKDGGPIHRFINAYKQKMGKTVSGKTKSKEVLR